MVSKTSLAESVRGFRWREVADGLAAKPELTTITDAKGRNWLHHCCRSPLEARESSDSIRTADVLLDAGLGLDMPAFREGDWQATPLWFTVSWGRNLALAEHLLKLGCNPNYCLFAAAWNDDRAAIRLLLAHGADIEDGADRGETPLLGAIAWSRFGPAEELLTAGADTDYRSAKGDTALHLMLRKGSLPEHFTMFVRRGARGDIADAEGRTAVDILRRKKDPAYHAIADQLAGKVKSALGDDI